MTTRHSRPVQPQPFDGACRRCTRLARFLDQVRARYPGYHCGPVPSFGAHRPQLLVVGLAPGMHGANRTGRPFTGDHAGLLLYRTLHATGFASAPAAVSADDDLLLRHCRVTNAVRCLPPGNKPATHELQRCNAYLAWELARVPPGGVVLALGTVAHTAVLRALGLRQRDARFAHGARHPLDGGRLLVDSYHCSRYNTQTGRLTQAMFAQAVGAAREWLAARQPPAGAA